MLMIRSLVSYPDHLRKERERLAEEEAKRVREADREIKRRQPRAKEVNVPPGMCTYCRKVKARENRLSCEPCAKKEAKRKRGSWEAARKTAEETGKCRDCMKRDRRPDVQTCEPCGAKRRKRAQNFRDRKKKASSF